MQAQARQDTMSAIRLGPLAGDPAGGRPNLAGRRKLEPSRPDPLRGNNTEIGIERLFEERSSRRGARLRGSSRYSAGTGARSLS